MTFWKSVGTALGAGALYLAKEAASELKIVPTIKELAKNKVFYTVTIGQHNQYIMFTELMDYLLTYHKQKFKNLSADISTSADSESDDLRMDDMSYEQLHYEIESDNILIEENGCKIWVKVYEKEGDNNNDISKKVIELSTFKQNNVNLNEFLLKILRLAKESKNESQKITTFIFEHGYWGSYRTYVPMPLERIFCKQSILDELVADIDKFLAKREWYLKRNISFKRGYLLEGKPRNGKSSIIAALARKYKRDIYYLTINSLKSEGELMAAFKQIPPKSFLVIEDIDKVWDKREAVNKKCPISFSTFINLLSGVLEKEDIIIFFTTNYIERLDAALIGDRRIDKRINIPQPSIVETKAYLSDLYDKPFDIKHYVEGRSVGALFNLYEDHAEDMAALVNLFENETSLNLVEEEPYSLQDNFDSDSDDDEDNEDEDDDSTLPNKTRKSFDEIRKPKD
jgi:hypothetical protein